MIRIGHLYPSGGICDHEVQVMAPEGVRFLTTRMPFRSTDMQHGLGGLFQTLEAQATLLADAEVELIAVNCTAATMLAGPHHVNQRVQAATGIAGLTTIEAVLAALQACSMQRIALLTPYPPEVVAAETAFLARQGVTVVASAGKPCETPVQQGEIPASYWLEAGSKLADTECDGLLISCAGVQVASVLSELEQIWRRPVVSSNQALVWHCLRRLGIDYQQTRHGSLFAR